METLVEFAKALAGMAIVMGIWFAVQALVRRVNHKAASEDVLDHLAHGCCGGCENAATGSCTKSSSSGKDQHHHEPA
jgi:hypothetical protein